MNALLIGSTGLVGSQLLKLLENSLEWKSITTLTRKPQPGSEKIKNVVVNFDNLDSSAPSFKADVCFCCLGTTIKTAGSQEAFRKVDFDYPLACAKAFKKHSPSGHFAIVTALGSNPKSSVFYSKVKGELEEALKELNLASLSILQPSLLVGDRKEERTGEKIAIALSPFVNPLLFGPLRKYRSITASDVASAMEKIGRRKEGGCKTFKSDILQEWAEA